MHQAGTTVKEPVHAWTASLAWAMVGAAAAFALVTFPTLGILLILLVAVVVAAKPALRRSVSGALTGAGAISLLVAYMQRRGPGTVCWHTANAAGCDQYLNPWPWLGAGVALVLVSLLAQTRRSSHR